MQTENDLDLLAKGLITVDELHPPMVTRLTKPGKDILAQLTPEKCNLIHAVLGLAGEVGEIIDVVKKHCIYNQELDSAKRDNLNEELGDLEFFLEQLRQELNVAREAILVGNYTKLSVRYKGLQYSDKAAEQRADKGL